MYLGHLLPAIETIDEVGRVIAALREPGQQRSAILGAAIPAAIAALARSINRPILILTARTERAKQLADQISVWLDEPASATQDRGSGNSIDVQLLPEPDGLPYERYLADPLTTQGRLRALTALARTLPNPGQPSRRPPGQPQPLVVASVQAVLPKTLSPEHLRTLTRSVKTGQRLRLDQFAQTLVEAGYEPVTTVSYPGTFARRGGIIDLFSPADELPVRIELFGDEVESIRRFDPASQRSLTIETRVEFGPARERLPRAEGPVSLDLHLLDPLARTRIGADLARLSQGQIFDGIDFYAGLLAGSSVLDYLGPAGILIVEDARDLRLAAVGLADQAESLRADLIARHDLPDDFPSPIHTVPDLMDATARAQRRLLISVFEGPEDGGPQLLAPLESFAGRLPAFIAEVQRLGRQGSRIVITSYQWARLGELLAEAGAGARHDDEPPLPEPGEVLLVGGTIGEGFRAGDLILFSDREIFGQAKPRRQVRARPTPPAVFLTDLTPGDFVVHIEHGIGRFSGLTTRAAEGQAPREYLILDYAEGDRLFVPTDHIDRVARYVGAGERPPSLTRLSSGEWARNKARVKRAVQEVAKDLLRIYAVRTIHTGHSFSPDSVWQHELDASFPYAETSDQLRAIDDVKRDMEQDRPMDRLVCGDVGFGKTEVAVRAAFKAVQDGYQVAVLVPTTILAQQHYETFRERLAAFPVRIESLSRFRSEKEQHRILGSLRDGETDIVIGTHRLIQKDVSFKNLGLVVVDEEQRFGVVHKELLKRMRTEVDVLTLTATPIPRTLHQALVGVRDLSTIDTAPHNRLPIKTTVAEFDDSLVRQAILREMDRGGQVFFVNNRVYNIEMVTEKLRRLVPEASFLIGHGQMPEEQLERVMLDFSAGKADVLVCTTIIESGLDMPNVNTIIVADADRFGLAQLYQLRGRVGRGANRAYAYFLFPHDRRLTETAEARLRTIFEATELGAGYRIAMRDLEIRGAGNLLGVEQSGNIASVGFDLYTRLLAEAVEEMKASLDGVARADRPVRKSVADGAVDEGPSIDLQIPAFLPSEFVEDTPTRLLIYQRLAAAKDPAEVEQIAQELRDRFGDLPEPARNLLFIASIRTMALGGGIDAIAQRDGDIVIQLGGDRRLDRARLEPLLGPSVRVGSTQLRIDRRRAGARWAEVLRTAVNETARR